MEISNLGFYFNKGYYSDKYKRKKDYLEALKNKTENKKNEEENEEINEEENEEINEEENEEINEEENEEENEEIKIGLDNFIETKVDDKIWDAYKHLDDLFAKNSKVTSFELNTAYPGVLVGTGYAHNSLDNEDFQNGFYFDYTTGFPMVPGSSIKGILRNAFPNQKILDSEWYKKLVKVPGDDFEKFKENNYEPDEDKLIKKYQLYCIENSKIKYISSVLEEISDTIPFDMSKYFEFDFEKIENGQEIKTIKVDYINFIVKEIFENQGIIFFDAYPVLEKGKLVLADDYITSHVKSLETEQDDLLSNPTPIRILKLNPGIKIKFNFKVSDKCNIFKPMELDENSMKEHLELGKNLIIELFRKILTDFGVGAKTSVGYGALMEEDSKIKEVEKNIEQNQQKNRGWEKRKN